MTLKGRVSPFGNPRIKACSQLPTAYRSVPRPSSPLGAKASTRCPCQTLDRFSHKPIQTRPKHPPRDKPKAAAEQSPDETMTAVKSLAFLSPAIQTSKSRSLLPEKTRTPRQPAGSPIHISNKTRPEDRNSVPKTLRTFSLAYRASRTLRPCHAGYRLAGSSHRNRAQVGQRPVAQKNTTIRSPQGGGWWSRTGSNRRPEACKATALPTELRPRSTGADAPGLRSSATQAALPLGRSSSRTDRSARPWRHRLAGGSTTKRAQAGQRPVAQTKSDQPEPAGRRLVGLARFELATSPLSGVRSNQLSYRPFCRPVQQHG